MAISLSPNVTTQEKDLTFTVQSITSNATGYVGMFNWGPADEIVQVTTGEGELLSRFGKPDAETALYFHSAANYMLYSNPLYVVRAVGTSAVNSISADSITPNVLIQNGSIYEASTLTATSFVGKFAGALGNSLKISIADSTGFATWDYKELFEFAPTGAEYNIVVLDEDGLISGSVGSVLEIYSNITNTPGAKKTNGTSSYIKTVLENQSNWIYAIDTDEIVFTTGLYEVSLVGGLDDNVFANGDFLTAWDLFSNKDLVDVIRVFTSGSDTTATGRIIDIADTRQDMIVFNAPTLSSVYNNATVVIDVQSHFETDLNKPTSYSFQCDNWKLVYDKYNDKNIWIPTDSDTAGLHALLFINNEPWDSPAGLNRGHLKNVDRLAWSSNEEQRNVLYKSSINSIVSFPGEGNVLFGDKTALRAPSAFSRINVRTLFIVIKMAISRAARYQLFELNDVITRSVFKNAVDQYLDNVQGRRGIYSKLVVCDETNNTGQVIDSNEMVGDIFIKPARSINNIKLNFVAVGTSVSFDEVQGA